MKKSIHFFGFYALCLIVQFSGWYFTNLSVHDWYLTLRKSPLTPPGMWFGIAWTTLYLLMAIAATRIYQHTGRLRCRPVAWWLIQLLLGLLWSIFFFGRHAIQPGMIIIATNWVAVLMTARLFARTDRLAAWLLAPLLAWLSFAAYLNLYILQHN